MIRTGLNCLAVLGVSLFATSMSLGQESPTRRSPQAQFSAAAGAQTRVVSPVSAELVAADTEAEPASTAGKTSSTRRFATPVAKSRLNSKANTQFDNTESSLSIQYDSISIKRPTKSRHMRDYSWIYIDQPQPREVKEHDIITIIVDEKSEVTQNARYTRQRMGQLKAELKEFVRLDDQMNLATAAANQPTIDGTLQSRLQSAGDTINTEGIRYRIAATVVDVLPNGHLVLEARKSIRANFDVWEYTLTGIIRSEDVNRDNTALSENIANLNIVKKQRGRVFDATKRPWGIFLWDMLMPF
ncbi:MAG: flagellar basal body L-ring protein FlgH [Planctomycetota bacterium]|nr:flagellar basal body L-ring protein FlgH [Planctomycetota bacterium]MDA1214084.1 flagellar basal body L-ring protein FlgH [Planctomycetota bacterium]